MGIGSSSSEHKIDGKTVFSLFTSILLLNLNLKMLISFDKIEDISIEDEDKHVSSSSTDVFLVHQNDT